MPRLKPLTFPSLLRVRAPCVPCPGLSPLFVPGVGLIVYLADRTLHASVR